MSKQIITIINGVEINAEVADNGKIFIPVKPICQAIGVDPSAQLQRIKRHRKLSSVVVVITTTGSDGKNYEMACIPVQYVYGWIFSIDLSMVSADALETVEKYQDECYDALYRHFAGSLSRRLEENNAEIQALEAVNAAISREKEAKAERRKAEENLARIRASRLDPTPCLEFD